jgi:hypothetical protein
MMTNNCAIIKRFFCNYVIPSGAEESKRDCFTHPALRESAKTIKGILNLIERKLLIVVFFLLFILFPGSGWAADYQLDYLVEYSPKKINNLFLTEVDLNIKITHFRSDIYVRSLTLKFPDTFKIDNLTGEDDNGKLNLNWQKENGVNNLSLILNNPNVGKDSINNIYLHYNQDKIFNEVGNVWEALIPVNNDENQGSYQVVINLPKEVDKQISIAKPIPTKIERNDQETKIYWINPKNKTLYVVFGNEQYYQFRIQYTLANDKLIPVIQTITLLPDTSYQIVYHNTLKPAPRSVYLDEDGNYLAQYLLSPKEIKKINYEGEVVITTKMNHDKIAYDRKIFPNQKQYLLTANKYWQLNTVPKTADSSPLGVYQYVVDTLQYNFENLDKRITRLGADQVLKKPNNAICLEFSDFYIALARENGIFSRQVIGYGFSQEERLRPLSLSGDVLHSWVEYYDVNNRFWKQIDPTWENTSGIDYFNSLDLNHIAFVIRGKDSQLPLPAGSFKLTPDQDIFIKPTTRSPDERIKLEIVNEDLPNKLFLQQQYKAQVVLKNLSNRILYNLSVNFNGDGINFLNKSVVIDVFPPFTEKAITVNLSANKTNKIKKTLISIKINNLIDLKKEVKIYPLSLELFYFIVIFLSLTTFLSVVLIIKRLKKTK